MSRRVQLALVAVWGCVVAWSPVRAVGQCCGDCNGDGRVTVNELVTAVSRALDGCQDDGVCDASVASCTATLSTCNSDLGTCIGNYRTCKIDREFATHLLTQCQNDLRDIIASTGLPATGQTTCSDTNGNDIACSGTGQDGDARAGRRLAYVDNGDGTITDSNTNLMWEKLSNDGFIHDKDNAYTWATRRQHQDREAERRPRFRGAHGLAVAELQGAGQHPQPAICQPSGQPGVRHGLHGELHREQLQLHAVRRLLVVY